MAQTLFEFVTETRWADLSPEARREARRCLMDLIGVAESPVGGLALTFSEDVRTPAFGKLARDEGWPRPGEPIAELHDRGEHVDRVVRVARTPVREMTERPPRH